MVFLDHLVALPILGRPVIHEAYWAGIAIVPVVLLAYAFEAWAVHFQLGPYIAKETRYFMVTNGIGAVVTVAGNLLLVPLLGLWGAAMSACLCYATIAVLMTRRSQKLYPIVLEWKTLAPILIWLALGWILGGVIQARPDRFGWGLRLGGLLAFYALPLVLGFFPLKQARALLASRRDRPAA
jgi:O-antigen/teichoic acid export membrane protein